MQETATYAAIKKQYHGEWVLIVDPVTTKDLEIVKGKVAWHSKDRKEVYRKAMELKPKHCAVLFLGGPPKDMEFALNL
ncbi:MAG: hypothetical protein HY289_11725 [Planctomycetes bacterium]|nr:hypothetical protein [Planctomycetota bacterium]